MKLSGLRNISRETFQNGWKIDWYIFFLFLHKNFNFPTMFCTTNSHTSVHSNFFFLGDNTIYGSQWSYALQAYWDRYVPVLLCTWGLWDMCVPKPVRCIDSRRFERVKANYESFLLPKFLHSSRFFSIS